MCVCVRVCVWGGRCLGRGLQNDEGVYEKRVVEEITSRRKARRRTIDHRP